MIRTSVRTLLFALVVPSAIAAQSAYVPPVGAWEKRAPEQVGLVKASVDSAVKIALASESTTPKDLLANHVASSFGRNLTAKRSGPSWCAAAYRD